MKRKRTDVHYVMSLCCLLRKPRSVNAISYFCVEKVDLKRHFFRHFLLPCFLLPCFLIPIAVFPITSMLPKTVFSITVFPITLFPITYYLVSYYLLPFTLFPITYYLLPCFLLPITYYLVSYYLLPYFLSFYMHVTITTMEFKLVTICVITFIVYFQRVRCLPPNRISHFR